MKSTNPAAVLSSENTALWKNIFRLADFAFVSMLILTTALFLLGICLFPYGTINRDDTLTLIGLLIRKYFHSDHFNSDLFLVIFSPIPFSCLLPPVFAAHFAKGHFHEDKPLKRIVIVVVAVLVCVFEWINMRYILKFNFHPYSCGGCPPTNVFSLPASIVL